MQHAQHSRAALALALYLTPEEAADIIERNRDPRDVPRLGDLEALEAAKIVATWTGAGRCVPAFH